MHSIADTVSRSRRSLVVGAALAFALTGTALSPTPAFGITEETEAKLTETQKKVEETAAAYEEATANLEALQAQIDENLAHITELEAQLPGRQEKAGEAMRSTYKNSQGTNVLMSMVLGSVSLEDLLTKMTYLNEIQSSTTEALDELNAAQQQLEAEQVELEQAKAQAKLEQNKADKALKEAQRLRKEAQAQADKEKAAELAALQAAAAELAAQNGSNAAVEAPAVAETSGVNWGVSQSEFVAEWTGRIDAYLAGSPLAGYGYAFADAAWQYGVDPRWSPAISNTESSKGRHCFRSHNAWGWGQIDWPDWETAIYAHVSGLARVYGHTISVQAAQKYCPPNWYNWYNDTSGQMARI